MKKLLAGFAALSLGMLGILSDAAAATTVAVGGNMGSEATDVCSDSARTFTETSVHQASFTLPVGTWQPFMGSSTSWRITGQGSSSYAGYVKIEIIEVAIFGALTVVSSFVRGFDTSGQYATIGIPDDQDFGSFTSVSAANGGGNYIIRVTAAADCGAFSTQSHVFNTNVNLVAF